MNELNRLAFAIYIWHTPNMFSPDNNKPGGVDGQTGSQIKQIWPQIKLKTFSVPNVAFWRLPKSTYFPLPPFQAPWLRSAERPCLATYFPFSTFRATLLRSAERPCQAPLPEAPKMLLPVLNVAFWRPQKSTHFPLSIFWAAWLRSAETPCQAPFPEAPKTLLPGPNVTLQPVLNVASRRLQKSTCPPTFHFPETPFQAPFPKAPKMLLTSLSDPKNPPTSIFQSTFRAACLRSAETPCQAPFSAVPKTLLPAPNVVFWRLQNPLSIANWFYSIKSSIF